MHHQWPETFSFHPERTKSLLPQMAFPQHHFLFYFTFPLLKQHIFIGVVLRSGLLCSIFPVSIGADSLLLPASSPHHLGPSSLGQPSIPGKELTNILLCILVSQSLIESNKLENKNQALWLEQTVGQERAAPSQLLGRAEMEPNWGSPSLPTLHNLQQDYCRFKTTGLVYNQNKPCSPPLFH